MPNHDTVNVRYMVDDVDAAVDFYTKVLDFELLTSASPAFADVKRGNLRLLVSGPTSSAGRPMPDGEKPGPGGWNRIHFIVDDLDAEVARLRDAGVIFRNDVVQGPGGKQILLQDPAGNVVELFEPARVAERNPSVFATVAGTIASADVGLRTSSGSGDASVHRIRRSTRAHHAPARSVRRRSAVARSRDFEDAIAACNLLPGPASTSSRSSRPGASPGLRAPSSAGSRSSCPGWC